MQIMRANALRSHAFAALSDISHLARPGLRCRDQTRPVEQYSKPWTCALIFDTYLDSFPVQGKSRALGAREPAARKNDILRAPRRSAIGKLFPNDNETRGQR